MPTELYENLQAPKKAVLAAVDTGAYDVEVSLAELRELAKTAGYPVVGEAVQKLQTPVAATFMGSGRLLELKDYMAAVEGELIIFDEELSPAQLRNIEELCDCPVLDRTMLILDIFAARAVSGEGKLQVELARLQYQLPRLAGKGVQLSRQGGGGTGGTGARRGAGESKLEVDRRHIRRRIEALKAELEALSRRREQRRARRKKDGITTVAIVGYTNVGKSTLLNTLTEAGVLAEDKLFATLDPTTRSLALPDGRTVMLIDTVGLVRRLPHQLVEAFHSTLEEAANADLILSVCDITSPELLEQRAVTERLLEELGVEGTPVITVLNKCDAAAPSAAAEPYRGCVRISAKTGYGLPALLQSIAETLPPARIRCRLCLPYTEGGLLHRLEQQGQIFCREYTAEGVLLEADVEQRDWPLYRDYVKTED
ncbi:MAG: GTPase HflX [Angelakisella sp.]|nr:GTPase HflX [Angelakisella sp.]